MRLFLHIIYIEDDVSINPKSYTNIIDLNLHVGENRIFLRDALKSSLLCNIIK